MPFAVVGSEKDVKTQDERVLKGRQYSWGIAEVGNEDHCDFKKLRSILIKIHMLDFRHTTEEIHCGAYRAQLRQKLKIKAASAPSTSSSSAGGTQTTQETSFIDKYLAGQFSSTLTCEEPILSNDAFLKLGCHISGATNHLRDGILTGLEEKIEKRSPTLDHDAVYTKA